MKSTWANQFTKCSKKCSMRRSDQTTKQLLFVRRSGDGGDGPEAASALREKCVLRPRERVGAHDVPAALRVVQHLAAALRSRADRDGCFDSGDVQVAHAIVVRTQTRRARRHSAAALRHWRHGSHIWKRHIIRNSYSQCSPTVTVLK